MHSVLSSLPYTDWGLCLSFKLQPVRFKLGWFEKGKTPHVYTAEKPQQKSGVLPRRGLQRAREQAESRPLPPGSGRGHRPLRPARGAAAAALPVPHPPAPRSGAGAGDTCRLVGVDAMAETRGGSPGRVGGGGRPQGDVNSHLERPERTQARGLELRGCLPRAPVRTPPGTHTAPDPPHGASAIPAPSAGLASCLCHRTSAFVISTRPTSSPLVAVSP